MCPPRAAADQLGGAGYRPAGSLRPGWGLASSAYSASTGSGEANSVTRMPRRAMHRGCGQACERRVSIPARIHPIQVMFHGPATWTLRTMTVPWPIRSVLAGAAGTTTTTLAYAAERRLRPSLHKPLDYDDSLVPGQIVAGIMHLPAATAREENELGLALRWSCGSVFGVWHGLLRRRIGEPWAGGAFGATLMTATLTLFPVPGCTPPPWRWPPSVIATAFGTHAAYVGAVAAVDEQNVWAAPFGSAVRKSGGQPVAGGRIPIQALAAAIEADEAMTKEGD